MVTHLSLCIIALLTFPGWAEKPELCCAGLLGGRDASCPSCEASIVGTASSTTGTVLYLCSFLHLVSRVVITGKCHAHTAVPTYGT